MLLLIAGLGVTALRAMRRGRAREGTAMRLSAPPS
ncbi:MAG: hypothetical protein IT531_07400 [Burkholderiales bacterium]|nr:hypothetical protein [Burkholderiales bacterium]